MHPAELPGLKQGIGEVFIFEYKPAPMSQHDDVPGRKTCKAKMLQFLFLVLMLSSFPLCNWAQLAPPFWNDVVAFKKQDSLHRPPMHPILFTGSSSFTRWTTLSADFPGYTVLNRAFGGSTLLDLIRYAYDAIIPYQPKQVIIYCGDNDLATPDSVSASEVINRFKTLFAIIRQNLPDATIDFVSIKPSPSRMGIIGRIRTVNDAVKHFLASQTKAAFIDIYPSMVDEKGGPRESLFVGDRLHMNRDGYLIWKKKIGPYLLR